MKRVAATRVAEKRSSQMMFISSMCAPKEEYLRGREEIENYNVTRMYSAL
jgi:hypothetical protein